MNKTELQQKIVDIEKQLAELKKELDKKDKGIWKPDRGKTYYYIASDGIVYEDVNKNFERGLDEDRFGFGNYYKTEKEAQKMANYLKYTNLLRKYVEEHSEPINWKNDEPKYSIWYDTDRNIFHAEGDDCYRQQGTIYASSEEVLKDAISFLGEENIKRYIFFIEE